MAQAKKYSRRVQVKIAQWYSDRERMAAEAEQTAAMEKRTKCRLRLWECEDTSCGKKLRVADDFLTAEHVHVDPETFVETRHRFVLRTPVLVTSATAPF